MSENDYKEFKLIVKPNALLKLNGLVVDWLSIDILSTNTHKADSFEIDLPISKQTNVIFDEITDTEQIEVDISIDDGSGTFKQLLLGAVDSIEEDYVTDKAILCGRDLTSLLLDAQTTERYPELSSSQIADLFADRHHLKKDIHPTEGSVGFYYNNSREKLASVTSEWDILVFLAQNEENFEVYIEKDTLHFGPASTTKNYYEIHWIKTPNGFPFSNVIRLEFMRNLTIANDVRILIKSHNVANQKVYSSTSRRRHVPQRVRSGGKTQTYIAHVANLDQEQTNRLSQQILRQISQHEKRFSATLQGDTILSARSIIKVNGVNKKWDQLYYPYNIHRHLSFGEPFTMIVEAKNHSVNSQVEL